MDVLALAVYTFAMSITPGPNNVMLTASGANFGFRRTLPHMLGITFGFALQAVVVSLGLGAALARLPHLQQALAWVGAAYLCWMGWRLLGAGAVGEGRSARPLTAWQAAAFQFVNPKAWVIALTVGLVFKPPAEALALAAAVMFGVLVTVNFPCIVVWAAAGSAMRRWLEVPRRRRIFNAVMALLLVACAVMMVG